MHMPKLNRPHGKETGRVYEQPKVMAARSPQQTIAFAHHGPFPGTRVDKSTEQKEKKQRQPLFLAPGSVFYEL